MASGSTQSPRPLPALPAFPPTWVWPLAELGQVSSSSLEPGSP